MTKDVLRAALALAGIAGNWWRPAKPSRGCVMVEMYYELNGVMFAPGRQIDINDTDSENVAKWCAGIGDAKMAELLANHLRRHAGEDIAYFAEVARRVGEEIPDTTDEAKPTKEERDEIVRGFTAKAMVMYDGENKGRIIYFDEETLARIVLDVSFSREDGKLRYTVLNGPQHPATPTETPRISTKTAETENVPSEVEIAEKTPEIESYNVEYYIGKYGTVKNLTKDYIGAIDGLRAQYRQYENNPRRGGRYRREKMEHIRQQAEAIYDELLRVSRAMADYLSRTPPLAHGTPSTVHCAALADKPPQRARKRPNRAISGRCQTPWKHPRRHSAGKVPVTVGESPRKVFAGHGTPPRQQLRESLCKISGRADIDTGIRARANAPPRGQNLTLFIT